ncbi:MAG: Holliday junction branch migration protein RuvA [Gammaproteobacteria bacterium]|uniref:Holliday junction branch migration protein RuvA n=1 Tax=Pseudomaricurvus alcaniphilus TaxID=1166482 RepID=UPI001408D884|nr:Holliday junction branch migration protein RuvA [Pseudomaricurvus alcaniphilus]MBR9908868.1 Holliday junction branch migration protein RuvA [Gammaproteobacteria bacterium]NHN37921.1 Holliday junction branch migration protein RuvA [Pseudomaricurvus alcaniphilus]
MIGRLQGVLLEVQAPEILVDVQGVGYEVFVPMTTLYQLPQPGSSITLLTHFAVSENGQSLYGFYARRDRDLFRTLIKVNGVGPRLALAILSGLEATQLVSCVRENNLAALVKVPGVGKKTAERLVIELRDKLKDWEGSPSPQAGTASNSTGSSVAANAIIADAESALVALGYKPVEASKVIAAVTREHDVARSEDLIRLALKSLVPA